jgi:hypothetical protein
LTRAAADGRLAPVPIILNANAIVNCSHMGLFKFVPTSMNVLVNNMPVLVMGDTAVPMSPCPFATAAGPAPCVQLTPPSMGFSTKVFVKGKPVLMQNAMFMTVPAGAGAPVPAMVQMPGGTTVMANG